MPRKLPTACRHPGCPETTTERYCPAHSKLHSNDATSRADITRNNGKDWYLSSRWRSLRARVLQVEPLCRACGAPASMVDHILPINEGGSRTDPLNLQPMCDSCHAVKRSKESRRFR